MEFVFVISAVVLFFYLKIKAPEISGRRGERIIANRLSGLEEEYHVFNNVLLRGRDGKTTQIDHVVVSPYKIFVIETKNMKGLIVGSQFSDEWRQYPRKGKRYFTFQNPIKQNYGHWHALQEALSPFPGRLFTSIVVFPRWTKLSIKMKENPKNRVIKSNELLEVIYSYQEKLLSQDQVNKAVRSLQENNIQNKKNMKEHIRNVKSKVY